MKRQNMLESADSLASTIQLWDSCGGHCLIIPPSQNDLRRAIRIYKAMGMGQMVRALKIGYAPDDTEISRIPNTGNYAPKSLHDLF